MNIHEHQSKELLKKYGIPVPEGFVIFDKSEISKKLTKNLNQTLVIKAQIHAGGRGKAGGIKIVKNLDEAVREASIMLEKILVTPQTGPKGKKVKRLYIEETCDIASEFYLSCLVDRSASKIAFISSAEGGMDIEEVAKKNPKKITTVKISLSNSVNKIDVEKILKPFNLPEKLKKQAENIIQSLYKILIEKDANLIEINPFILNKNNNLLCLDAKINFDDNALYRNPDIFSLKDFNEEDPIETEASKYGLSYIKLDGKIGCMVNGAGLAMATMDIIKLYGSEPANFLDVGGGASKEKVSEAFKIILSDKNVKGILINIFGGIMRCDVLAEGVVQAAKEIKLSLPLVVRLAGTNEELGKKILKDSNLKIISASNLSDAAKKIVEATS
jgi:succinyl-CoA synthetase beta subunit